jgi:hypothetical protein
MNSNVTRKHVEAVEGYRAARFYLCLSSQHFISVCCLRINFIVNCLQSTCIAVLKTLLADDNVINTRRVVVSMCDAVIKCRSSDKEQLRRLIIQSNVVI